MSGGGAEAGTAPIQAMVGSACSRYPGDKGEACISGGGRWGDGDGRIRGRGRERVGQRRIKLGDRYD